MSGQTEKTDRDESKLSPTTLAVASAASVAAAIFVHEIWNGGAIVGAAITPIIVAVVSESLKKPAQKIGTVTPVTARPARRGRTRAPEAVEAQAVELQREDRFGIWEDRKRKQSPWHKLNRKHLKIALATGALAFIVGAIALTGAELVFGGSVGSSGERTTIFQGGGKKKAGPATTTTTTTEEQAPAVEQPQTEPVPQEEEPPATTPTAPPPATTEPAPAPESGATPAPAEPAPGATQPEPVTPVP